MVWDSNLLPLLIKRSLVEFPFGWFSLELLIQGISQGDEGRVQEIHGKLRAVENEINIQNIRNQHL